MRNWRFKWTEEQEQILLDHILKNGNDKELIEKQILPFSLNAIRKKKCRLICKTEKKTIIKYSPKLKNLFKSFLTNNWKNNTPDELAQMWNEKYLVKTNRRKVIFYLSEMKIKVPYNEIHRIKIYKKLLENQEYEKARSFKIKMFQKRLENGLDIWTGLKLDPSIDPLEGMFVDGKSAKNYNQDELNQDELNF